MIAETDWPALQRELARAGERRLVLVEGDREQALEQLRRILAQLTPAAGLWSGPEVDRPHSALTVIAPTQGRRWLGTETRLLVWDGWHGNPPDSLAALTGTLTAGGLWFWLMPELAHWSAFADPDYRRTGLEHSSHHAFAGRMAVILARDPAVLRVNATTGLTAGGIWPRPPRPPFRLATTADQAGAIDRIIATGSGHRRRPLVLTADRGRGKSAALGMAATRLLQQGRRHIAVTAPGAAAVATLFRHAAEMAGQATPAGDHLVLPEGGSLRYYPVDELLGQRPEAELVIVDEAAAIPAGRLRKILLGWPRVVFASTLHGYEGSGRGFAIRFRQVLDRETPQWRSLTLSQPVRWSTGDPLEPLVDRLFLLRAGGSDAMAAGEKVAVSGAQACSEPERWSPAQAPEAELSQAFGLLVEAHYRTTPGDLRQWLDEAGAVSWVIRRHGTIVAVLWATREGGLDPDLAQAVMRGRRRLRGHLLPQSLAAHGGNATAATLSVLRIVRVAVSARCRRQGLGQALVKAALAHTREAGLDLLGTSYGASAGLLGFWTQAGLRSVRLGLDREASSGEYAVQMLAAGNQAGNDLASAMATRFSEHWPTLLPRCWPDLEPDLLLALTADLPPGPPLDADDRRDLGAFSDGFRGFELTLPVLQKLSRRPGIAAALQARSGSPLWCRAVMQTWRWPQLQGAGYCRGRADGQRQLRQLAGELLPLA